MPGPASRTQALAERMMAALDEGYEGFGWRVFESGRALGTELKATPGEVAARLLQRSERADQRRRADLFMTKEIMSRLAPSLVVVNFWDIDIAHYGAYSLYSKLSGEPIAW